LPARSSRQHLVLPAEASRGSWNQSPMAVEADVEVEAEENAVDLEGEYDLGVPRW